MKNPYIFGYLPFVNIVLFSLTFGVYAVSFVVEQFKHIGLYEGLLEFFSDIQIRLLFLIVFAVLFFMIFSALKLIAETIHETAMLFFAKEVDPSLYRKVKSGNLIYFLGALISIASIQSLLGLVIIFAASTLLYFNFLMYQLSKQTKFMHLIGLIFFEIMIWATLLSVVAYALLKLYNGIVEAIPLVTTEQ